MTLRGANGVEFKTIIIAYCIACTKVICPCISPSCINDTIKVVIQENPDESLYDQDEAA